MSKKYVPPALRGKKRRFSKPSKETPKKRDKKMRINKQKKSQSSRDRQWLKQKRANNKTKKYRVKKKRRKSSKKSKSQKGEKEDWLNDWNWPPKIKNKKKQTYALPAFTQVPNSNEMNKRVGTPKFIKKSPDSLFNFSDADLEIIKTAMEDAFKSESPKSSSPKPNLLTPAEIIRMNKQSKRNPNLLTPQEIMNFSKAKGITKKKSNKRKSKSKTKKKSKKKNVK